MTEAWPTEAAATKAVEAVARKAFEDSRAEVARQTGIDSDLYPSWDDAGPVIQHQWRDRVLPLVWATIEALPDPRHAAWAEGAASTDYDFESGNVEKICDNPYPGPA